VIEGFLNRSLDVFRPSTASDGSGGRTTQLVPASSVRAMVSQPSAQERESGGQWGARHTHSVYVLPSADIRRGDELRGGGQNLRVLAVIRPSRSVYRKAVCQLIEQEGA